MERKLSDNEKSVLLEVARNSIIQFITDGTLPLLPPPSGSLGSHRGCFVTIKQGGSLRGCIGSFTSEDPLCKLVQEMAISAATRDPRFYPMKKGDLNDFRLEISVLSPMHKISSIDEIIAGTHGLYIEKNYQRGVLLPQVAVEQRWDRDTFLAQTCLKAGLPPDAWQEGASIHIFSAEVF
ncbi:AmmeMemoRadiSam system protein A [Geobacter sp. DSM 9736]|uniref:AmmeMemoRadiSam system protein A n=1 Tax=Geobacter sp. DSM 9736 TaxID=1277350 RepID=UPI000B5097BC|nr:AmmeMemoRadiSam system protein A [Geobacter sp. DSM 9736]SNB44878.1 hypothetical protein SAMN06269301_0268 [Geobacter sp. DSM 9736]